MPQSDRRKVTWVSSVDYDLTDSKATRSMLEDIKPDKVIHLAAYSGGIGANRAYPADFFHINAAMVVNIFDAAAKAGIQKLIYTMGGCSYPSTASSPINESQMWNGYPQLESAGYSMAKKLGIVASESYRTQYGLNSVVLIPGNMYGEYDNFRNGESHVVPGMIRRYVENTISGNSKIEMWGDGRPVRDFVYAADVAKVIPWFLDNYNSSDPVNISTGSSTTMMELANLIKGKLGWNGDIEWDTSKPNGQMLKTFDVSRLNSLGLSCDTELEKGLDVTIDWFLKNFENKSDGIRL